MKLCGHTMGTPALDIFGSIDLFADLGLDGIEVRCANDGHINPEALTESEAERIRAHAEGKGVAVACLTPYYKDFATDEATEQTLGGFRIACRAAGWLDCGLVRALAGIWPVAGREREDIFERTIAGLRQAAEIASEAGVRLALENHIGTLCMSAREAVDVVQAVDHPSLGLLMDYYWNVVAGDEDNGQAVPLMAPHILHCHAKNLIWEDGKYVTVLLDEGVIDWQQVIGHLRDAGYEGYLSDEYEKFWKPEFPEPEVGMKRNAEHIRRCLTQ